MQVSEEKLCTRDSKNTLIQVQIKETGGSVEMPIYEGDIKDALFHGRNWSGNFQSVFSGWQNFSQNLNAFEN